MIDKLEMFLALAAERHFGRAAESLGVTQPSLSSALKSLEEQLGVQLVHRGARFQGLTPEGARVLDWARRIVGDSRAMREEMRAARQGLAGNLRLGVIPTALPRVARLTAPFMEKNPNARLTILSRTSSEILEGIESLELDAGLTYLDNEPLGRVHALPLYRETYRLLVPAGHEWARREAVSWAEAATAPLCLLTPNMQNRRIINAHLAQGGGPVAPRIESNSTIVLAAHVASGRWCSVVSADIAEVFSEALVAIPLSGRTAEHMVGLIATPREPHTPMLAALYDEARKLSEA